MQSTLSLADDSDSDRDDSDSDNSGDRRGGS